MAKVKIEEIIGHIDSNIRLALRDAVYESMPDIEFDEYALFRSFKHAVGRKCSIWERVPDKLVEIGS